MLQFWASLQPQRRVEITFSLAVLGVVIGTIGLAEAVLQLRERKHFSWGDLTDNVMYPRDDGEIRRLIPGAKFGAFSVNSLGLRGPEVEMPKPAGTLRLAFLGDSLLLGASLEQRDTLSDLVSAAVQKSFPECNVDYITVAAPSYSFDDANVILGEVRPKADPDAYVVLMGNFIESLRALEDLDKPQTPYMKSIQEPRLELLLWKKISYRYQIASEAMSFGHETDLFDRIDPARFIAAYNALLAPLVEQFADAPVAIVNYRGQERTWMDDRQLTEIFQGPMSQTVNLSISGVIKLHQAMEDDLAATARAKNWSFGDPLDDLPPTVEYYEDRLHLNARGDREMAGAIADLVVASVHKKGFSCSAP
jgi:hypothetical protein